jgi:hypothetical protein
MKKLIKLTVLLIVLSIFIFSKNQTINNIRIFVFEKGKIFYDKGIREMKTSNNQTIAKVGEKLQ